ncbi:MAG TPA: hypothetical protein VIN61_01855 [Gammaproteobacteria bacterium]
MKCEDIVTVLRLAPEPPGSELRLAAERHAAECRDCRRALLAHRVLQEERLRPVPRPPEGALQKAVDRAVAAGPVRVSRARGFWLGMAVGGALAASMVLAVTMLLARVDPSADSPVSAPQIALAAHESRDVSVALNSAERLSNVEIQVAVTGAIALRGYESRRELRWFTDLERGVNELTLPIVALGPGSGQLMVQVTHGDRRRTFVVDVHARG